MSVMEKLFSGSWPVYARPISDAVIQPPSYLFTALTDTQNFPLRFSHLETSSDTCSLLGLSEEEEEEQ
jgi:hypothetical protein